MLRTVPLQVAASRRVCALSLPILSALPCPGREVCQ